MVKMKKAKQYAQDLIKVCQSGLDNNIKVELNTISEAFFVEVKEICDARHCKTDTALMNIIREQNNKWNSMINRVCQQGYNLSHLINTFEPWMLKVLNSDD